MQGTHNRCGGGEGGGKEIPVTAQGICFTRIICDGKKKEGDGRQKGCAGRNEGSPEHVSVRKRESHAQGGGRKADPSLRKKKKFVGKGTEVILRDTGGLEAALRKDNLMRRREKGAFAYTGIYLKTLCPKIPPEGPWHGGVLWSRLKNKNLGERASVRGEVLVTNFPRETEEKLRRVADEKES